MFSTGLKDIFCTIYIDLFKSFPRYICYTFSMCLSCKMNATVNLLFIKQPHQVVLRSQIQHNLSQPVIVRVNVIVLSSVNANNRIPLINKAFYNITAYHPGRASHKNIHSFRSKFCRTVELRLIPIIITHHAFHHANQFYRFIFNMF